MSRSSPAAVPPVVGSRPDPWTGWVGALAGAPLLVVYAIYLRHHPGGGPRYHLWLAEAWRGRPVVAHRDLIDVLLLLAIVTGAMAGWERLTGWRRRAFPFVVLGTILGVVAAVVVDGPPWAGATPVEVALGSGLLGLFALFAGELAQGPARALRRPRPLARAARVALSRWGIGLLVLLPYAAFILQHPYFSTSGLHGPLRLALWLLLPLYVVIGPFWMVLTEWYRGGRDDPRKDAFFPVLALLWLGRRWGAAMLRKRWVRTGLLDLVVKFFFFPIMFTFVFTELNALIRAVHQLEQGKASGAYDLCLHVVLIVDVVIGAIGYAATSRWLGNKSVSVDPTGGGWAIALFCYPPFNSAAGTLFPFKGNGQALPAALQPVFLGAMLLLFAIYTWATIAFGLRFSNLTHRGVIDHGPYRWVRHPAYAAKLLAWWMEWTPRFTTVWQPVSLALFCGVYILRALTEERHLRADPAYREYAARVRYRFIPGLI